MTALERPGFFGTRKAKRIEEFNQRYGEGNWDLAWYCEETQLFFPFEEACKTFYERSYIDYFSKEEKELDFVCSFGEVIDNNISNIKSGFDYTIQETKATHIQDIAIRNAIHKLGRKFEGDQVLVVRGADSAGFKYGPGNIPSSFNTVRPSLRPWWAKELSVEDFWQSNKYVVEK